MTRRFLNMFCSVLVLASYLWGGCVTCREIVASKAKPADCCQRDKCKRSSHSPDNAAPQSEEVSCERADWAIATVPESRTQIASLATVIDWVAQVSIDASFVTQTIRTIRPAGSPPSAFPPDLTILHVSFLI